MQKTIVGLSLGKRIVQAQVQSPYIANRTLLAKPHDKNLKSNQKSVLEKADLAIFRIDVCALIFKYSEI